MVDDGGHHLDDGGHHLDDGGHVVWVLWFGWT